MWNWFGRIFCRAIPTVKWEEFVLKQWPRITSLVVVLMAGWFAQADPMAQAQPLFLRLKGIAIGSSVQGAGTDVQMVGNYACLVWSGDTNHRGGLEIFSATNPSVPIRADGNEFFCLAKP